MTDADAPTLLRAVDTPDIFEWSSIAARDLSEAENYVAQALTPGHRIAFLVLEEGTGTPIGSTSYYDVTATGLAIGYTWYSRRVQGTTVNPAAKLLLLERAFEDLGSARAEWHVDADNARSRAAVLKLGARQEGILRKHSRRRDGSWRDTVVFSLLDDEWPAAKAKLLARVRQAR